MPAADAGRADGPDEPEDRQPGLARERTDLAWTRTAIAFAATGAAILKTHVVEGIIVLGLGLATWGVRRLFPARADDESSPRRLLLVTIAVLAVAAVSLGVSLTAS
jgi:uncharacterized membrane protein YidH (DUF202 family)